MFVFFFLNQLVLLHPVSDFDSAGVRRCGATPISGGGGSHIKKDGGALRTF